MACFELTKHNFKSFDEFNTKLENEAPLKELISQGKPLLEYKREKVEHLAARSYLVDLSAICSLSDPTMQVPCVNTPVFHSEVGNYMAKNAPLAITWYKAEDGKCRHSLRSNKVDCSAIAAFWGGGGHAAAAGFTTDEPLPAMRSGK
jgi:hypothetical protein